LCVHVRGFTNQIQFHSNPPEAAAARLWQDRGTIFGKPAEANASNRP
jgi:hypothetical protein